MRELMYTIYLIRHKGTKQRLYIGQTIRGLKTRLREHRCASHDSAVLAALKRYGANNIEIVAIDSATSKKEALYKEEFWTRFLRTGSTLTNRTYSTSDGYFLNSKIREKYSQELFLIETSRNGENNYLYTMHHTLFPRNDFWGRKIKSAGPMSDKNKKAISDALKAKYQSDMHHMFGRHLSDETKQKISLANKGKTIPLEQRRKISQALTGIKRKGYSEQEKQAMRENSSKNIAIECVTTGERYFSMSEAARQTGTRADHISSCCRGQRKSAGKLKDGTKLVWRRVSTEANQPAEERHA